MTDTNIILLLSKYSSECNQLVQIMKTGGVSFSFLNTIFIDNPEIRASILRKKEYNIHSVPTILVFEGNRVDKFEDGQAFEWVIKTIENIKNEEKEELNNQIQNKVNAEVAKIKAELEAQMTVNNVEEKSSVEEIESKNPHEGMAISSIKDDTVLPNKIDLTKIWDEEEKMTHDKMIDKSIRKSDRALDVAERMEKEREELFSQQKQNNPQ